MFHQIHASAFDRCKRVWVFFGFFFHFCHHLHTLLCSAQFRALVIPHPLAPSTFHLIFQPVTGEQLLTVVTLL